MADGNTPPSIIVDRADLSALPVRAVVLDRDGDAWQRTATGWNCTVHGTNTENQPSSSLTAVLGPLLVISTTFDTTHLPPAPGRPDRSTSTYRETVRTAAKVHVCADCHQPINVGDRYVIATEYPGGESGYADAAGHPVSLKVCGTCADLPIIEKA